jgi:hypothetical protein
MASNFKELAAGMSVVEPRASVISRAIRWYAAEYKKDAVNTVGASFLCACFVAGTTVIAYIIITGLAGR